MADKEHVEILKQGAEVWNSWREKNPEVKPDLSQVKLINADLSRANLDGVDLRRADLSKAQLSHSSLFGANLESATLILADLLGAVLNDANLSGASFFGAFLFGTRMKGANLDGANLLGTTLMGADLSGAKLRGAHLMAANFHEANLTGADLSGSDLTAASLVGTRVKDAVFEDCMVHGISAWNLEGSPRIQKNLSITARGEPPIRVSDLEHAQFCNLLAYSGKLSDLLKQAPRIALIIGRFSADRVSTLEVIQQGLLSRGYLPVCMEPDKPVWRGVTKSLSPFVTLARLIVVDLTDLRNAASVVQPMIGQRPRVPIVQIAEDAPPTAPVVQALPPQASVLEVSVYRGGADLRTEEVIQWIHHAEQRATELRKPSL
jgi:uncharacterized protein YjbI with pentapeptide repeats